MSKKKKDQKLIKKRGNSLLRDDIKKKDGQETGLTRRGEKRKGRTQRIERERMGVKEN